MQPVVMAPKNLSTKHCRLNKIKEKDNTAEEHQRETEERPKGNMTYTRTKKAVDADAPNPGEAVYGREVTGEAGEPLASGGVKPGGRQ